jgi:hypothetical protein
MKKPDDDKRVEMAKAALRRVEQEGDKNFSSNPLPNEFGDDDPIELWGKRIGRIIGYSLVMFAIWHLYTTYIMK